MPKTKDVTDETVFAARFGASVVDCPPPILMRRIGVMFHHRVNPNAVMAEGIRVVRISKDFVRVNFRRIVLAPGESEWVPSGDRTGPAFPLGVPCAGGDGNHKQGYQDSVVVDWAEVAL